MTYNALLKRLLKMTPAERKQQVTLKEGCSDNVTHVTAVYKARTDEMREELIENEPDEVSPDGVKFHWKETTDLRFKKGQIWLLHDH